MIEKRFVTIFSYQGFTNTIFFLSIFRNKELCRKVYL